MGNLSKYQFDFKSADKMSLNFLKSPCHLYQSSVKKKVIDQIGTVKIIFTAIFLLKKTTQ